MDMTVAKGKYRLGKKIGEGSFGEIYVGQDVESGEKVAVKLEPADTDDPQLKFESRIYQSLSGRDGVPRVKWYGTEKPWNILVMDLLGPSLEDIFQKRDRHLKMRSVLMVGQQLVTRLETLHAKDYLHRDVKPDNFLVGLSKTDDTVYMIDLGLAKQYRDHRTLRPIKFKEGKGLTGTPRYASINTQIGVEQARRDDLESLGYVLVYLWKGSLPWQGMKGKTKKQRYQRILESKISTTPEDLCKGMPDEFVSYFQYIRSLRFDDQPDYSYLRGLFKQAFEREGFSEEGGIWG